LKSACAPIAENNSTPAASCRKLIMMLSLIHVYFFLWVLSAESLGVTLRRHYTALTRKTMGLIWLLIFIGLTGYGKIVG
jgi:uncharacterized membrane protein